MITFFSLAFLTKSSEISRTTGAHPIFENLSCLNLPTTNLCILQEGTCDRVFLWSAPTEQNPQTEVQRLWLRLQKGELLVQQQSNNPSQRDRKSSRCQFLFVIIFCDLPLSRGSSKIVFQVYLTHTGTSASVLPIKVPIHVE